MRSPALPSLLLLLAVWSRAGLAAAADGRLAVRAPWYGLTVAVDRRPVGRTPLEPLAVAPGFHLVEVLRGGRAVWARLVFVTEGATLAVDVEAPAADEAPPVAADAAGPPPPRFDLNADVALRAARLGGEGDLDLRQGWRLAGARLAGPDVDGALRLAAWSDLDGEGDALPGAHGEGTEMAVEEAWLGYGARSVRLEGGRVPVAGPGGVPLLVDGGRARVGGDAWVEAIGGRMADPPFGARGGLGGLAVGGAGISLRYLYFRMHHADAGGAWAAGPASLSLDARAVDGAPALAGGRAALRLGAFDAWFEARRRFAAEGPFEDPARWLGVRTPPPPAGWEGALGAGLEAAGLTAHLTLAARRPDAKDPAWAEGTVDVGGAAGAWTWVAAADALFAEPASGPSVERSLGARLSAAGRAGPWRLDGSAGVRRLRAGDARLLPEGSVRVSRRLADALDAYLDGATAAVHPALWPDGGPLSTFTLGVTLR